MTIIGFNFSKLYAVHKKASKGDVKVATNIKIDAIEKTSINIDESKLALKASFTYTIKYDPDIGSLELQGDLLFVQETKVAEAFLAEWEKKRSMPRKASSAIVNAILPKCVVQALIMTKDIGLPSPIPLPRMKSSNVKVEKDAADKKK
ncbi:hypothetical protein JXA12_00845 [Candidatus Woesearchaeota archaeon]|nr:hypothetical protein [Candidatus Woesearchaeota archaeon]